MALSGRPEASKSPLRAIIKLLFIDIKGYDASNILPSIFHNVSPCYCGYIQFRIMIYLTMNMYVGTRIIF
nr:MAG TPA: hypothetical protein [Caudoviricetes sp.]